MICFSNRLRPATSSSHQTRTQTNAHRKPPANPHDSLAALPHTKEEPANQKSTIAAPNSQPRSSSTHSCKPAQQKHQEGPAKQHAKPTSHNPNSCKIRAAARRVRNPAGIEQHTKPNQQQDQATSSIPQNKPRSMTKQTQKPANLYSIKETAVAFATKDN